MVISMKWLLPLLVLLLVSSVSAQAPINSYEVDGELTVQDIQDQIKSQSDLGERIEEMGQINKENLEAVYSSLVALIQFNQTATIIAFVLVSLGVQGMWWAIYLYFKSRKRI